MRQIPNPFPLTPPVESLLRSVPSPCLLTNAIGDGLGLGSAIMRAEAAEVMMEGAVLFLGSARPLLTF